VALIGGALVIAGCMLCMLAGAMGFFGVDVRWMEACWQWAGCGDLAGGGISVPHLIGPASLTLLGIGFAALGLAGRDPLRGGVLRLGLVTLGVGLLSHVVGTNLPVREGSNTLESWPIVIARGVGSLAVVVGFLVTGIALVREPGPLRLIGSCLLGGLALLPLAVILATGSSDGLGGPLERALGVLALIGILVGGIGVGVLAIRGGRSAPD
jgi:hypothetical protein